MPGPEQPLPHQAFAAQANTSAFSPGAEFLTLPSGGGGQRPTLAQRSLALLRGSARKPLALGAVAMAVALPLLIRRQRNSKSPASGHPAPPRPDEKISWISAAWNAFVLVRNFRRRSEEDAAHGTNAPARAGTQPPVEKGASPVAATTPGKHRLNLKSIYALLKTSVSNWSDDFAPSMG